MRSLVANGFGFSIANVRPLNDRSADGKKVCYIPLISDLRPIQMGLLMAAGARNSFTIQAFVEHCNQTITQESVPGMNSMDQKRFPADRRKKVRWPAHLPSSDPVNCSGDHVIQSGTTNLPIESIVRLLKRL